MQEASSWSEGLVRARLGEIERHVRQRAHARADSGWVESMLRPEEVDRCAETGPSTLFLSHTYGGEGERVAWEE